MRKLRQILRTLTGDTSGFSPMEFQFSLTRMAVAADTIGLQPMEFQFQPNQERAADPIGPSGWSFSFSLRPWEDQGNEFYLRI